LDSFNSIVPLLYYFAMPSDFSPSLPVVVLTEHYGKVMLHERGVRSEFAKPIGTIAARTDLNTFKKYHETLETTTKMLGVPVYDKAEAQKIINLSRSENNV
jgi:hypothetical protein